LCSIHADKHHVLPVSRASELLSVSRSGIYYKPSEPSPDAIAAKNLIDKLHTAHPAWGSRQLSKQLKAAGMNVGRLKTRKYMSEMGIEAIYPKPSLSKAAKNHQIYPYLLRNFVPNRPNQAWSIDITYIRMKHGFMYLTAVIDWHSRMIVGWELDDTLSARMVISAVNKAFETAKPEILNSDQGSQFTSKEYIDFVESNRVKISMDGKGRWADNIPIERWFRTLKYEEIYLKDYESPKEARQEIGKFIHDYNFKRIHSAVDSTPAFTYYPAQLYDMLTASPVAILDRPA
jgi:putative transposase